MFSVLPSVLCVCAQKGALRSVVERAALSPQGAFTTQGSRVPEAAFHALFFTLGALAFTELSRRPRMAHAAPAPAPVQQTPLGRSLIEIGFKAEAVEATLSSGRAQWEPHFGVPVASLTEEAQMTLIGQLSTAVVRRQGESKSSVLARDARALFVYGTLRPDYSGTGDRSALPRPRPTPFVLAPIMPWTLPRSA